MRRGYDRTWTIVLNNANQSEEFQIPLPDAEGFRYRLSAWAGGASQQANVLLFSGDYNLAQLQGGVVAGNIDVKMVVPRGGVGVVETDGFSSLSVFADAVIPAGQNLIVSIRLTQIG